MKLNQTVMVVGGGPTGLLLAGDLAAAGVACTVLERRRGQSNLTRRAAALRAALAAWCGPPAAA